MKKTSHDFKIGDKIKVVEARKKEYIGAEGYIYDITPGGVIVQKNEFEGICFEFDDIEKIEDKPQAEPFELKDGMKFKVIGDKTQYTLLKIGYEFGCERYYNYSKDFIDWEATRKLNEVNEEPKPKEYLIINVKNEFDIIHRTNSLKEAEEEVKYLLKNEPNLEELTIYEQIKVAKISVKVEWE